MNLWKKLASGSLTASLLASLLAVFAGTAIAATASPATTTVVPNGTATALPLATVTATAPTDIPAGTLTLTLPAGYSWAATGTIATVETGGTLAVTDGAVTLGGTTATFAASGTAVAGSTIAFSSPTVKTSTSGASGSVVLSGLVSPGSVVVAKLQALYGPYGSAIVYYASATHVPADGTSSILLTFVGGGVPAGGSAIVATSAGQFTGSTGLTFSGSPTYPTASLPGITAVAASATVTLRSAATAGNASVSVQTTPLGGGTTTDSTTTFQFTAKGGEGDGDHWGRDHDRGMGHGARKVGFFLDPAYTCPTGAQPIANAPTFGFAILNRIDYGKHMAGHGTHIGGFGKRLTGYGRLIVTVVLRGALANATYDVWVNQDPGGCPLGAASKAGAVHTDANGNGTGHVKVDILNGAQRFWVSATSTSGGSVLRTRATELKTKHHH
jgi:hypothetical protein